MSKKIEVGIVMGSDSDWPKIRSVTQALDMFGVGWEAQVASAHRTPDKAVAYATNARKNGVKVLIAAAGGAAHLAGTLAAHTTLPVIGIPVETAMMGGLDSLLSTVQMPGDIPVATVGTGASGAKNAGILAVEILAVADEKLAEKLAIFRQKLKENIEHKNAALQEALREKKE